MSSAPKASNGSSGVSVRLGEKATKGELAGSAGDASFLILTDRDYKAVRFALDLVDRLAAAHGFDPADLINPRTKEPFGPWIERVRAAMRLFEAMPPARLDRAREDGNRPRRTAVGPRS